MIENEFQGRVWTKNAQRVITNLNKCNSHCLIDNNEATNLVLHFVWLTFLAIGIYRLSYWHLDRFWPFLWSWLAIRGIFISRMTVTLRPTLWFVIIIQYLWFVLTLSSIYIQCGDVGNGIWPPQFGTLFLWCGINVAQLGGFIIT